MNKPCPSMDRRRHGIADCASPVLKGLTPPRIWKRFHGISWASLIGSVFRANPAWNAKISSASTARFSPGSQGHRQTCRKRRSHSRRWPILAIPIALSPMRAARKFRKNRWYAMTRLDENRGKSAARQKVRRGHHQDFQPRYLGQSQPDHVPRFLQRQDQRPARDGCHQKTKNWLKNDFDFAWRYVSPQFRKEQMIRFDTVAAIRR